MPSLAVLVFSGLVLGAAIGDMPGPCPQDGNGVVDSSQVMELRPGLGELPEPGRVPRGAWWYGARVPVPYQRQVYYPTWDTPVRLLFGFRPMGTPAVEVPQRPAAPAFWKPLDW